MTKAKKNAQKWDKKIEKVLTEMSKTTVKTTSEEKWNTHITTYIKNYEVLWNHYTKTKWNRQRFGVYIKKNKCLDTFFASMKQENEPKPFIAYGAAKFGPNGKGELSAPTTFLSKRCSNFYTVGFVDEYNTTKMCNCCGKELQSLYKEKDGKFLTVRGLKWCGSTTNSKLVNRDKNAALNILLCYLSGDKNRPQSLTRKPLKGGKSVKASCGQIKTNPQNLASGY